MNHILVCIHNPLLAKGICGILHDEGYHIELSEYPAQAIQQILRSDYQAVIIDVQAFGMPAEDAVRIIKILSPETTVILVGYPESETDNLSIKVPVDLEKVKDLVHSMHRIGAISS